MRWKKTKNKKHIARAQDLFEKAAKARPEERSEIIAADSESGDQTKGEVKSLLKFEKSKLLETPAAVSFYLPRNVQRVGPYLLLDRVGAGGMAEVYLGRKEGVRGFEKEVALKCILPGHVRNEDVNSWFEREAKLGSRLNHSNIAQILDFIRADNSYWLIMEYVSGPPLEKVIRKGHGGALKPATSCFIICEVLKALQYAHTWNEEGKLSPIIHRDLSPRNVMVSYRGEVKVVDFGIAKAVSENSTSLTQMGMVKGTPGYLPPEQAKGDAVDERADLYSLSVLLYELLEGKPLFPKGTSLSLGKGYARYIQARVEKLSAPVALQKILLKGLAWDREKRFTSAHEMYSQLEAVFKASKDFGQESLMEQLSLLFQKERAEERIRAENREVRIQAWKSEGMLQNDPSGLTGLATTAWKRSRLIHLLLVMIVLTTFMNLYLQLVPDSFTGGSVNFSRKIASPDFCSIKILSEPSGALVSANALYAGKTPATIRVHCGEKVNIRLEKPGLAPLEKEIKAEEPAQQLLLQLRR